MGATLGIKFPATKVSILLQLKQKFKVFKFETVTTVPKTTANHEIDRTKDPKYLHCYITDSRREK